MTEAGKRYMALIRELVRARVSAGGDLPMHVEARYVEKLDTLWESLDGAERETVERALADKELG